MTTRRRRNGDSNSAWVTEDMRPKTTKGGFLAGALVGTLAGASDACLFLEPVNLTRSFGGSVLFIVFSITLYATSFGLLGALFGLLAPASASRDDRHLGGVVGRSFARVFGTLVGLIAFVLGAWRLRMAPPDLSVFRRYCFPGNLVIALAAIACGAVAFLIAGRIVRLTPLKRLVGSRRTPRVALVVLGVLASVSLLAASNDPATRSQNPPGGDRPARGHGDTATSGRRANVVLMTIDTLRANHLTYLGYDKPTSPTISGYAEQSVTFPNAVVQFPLTTPSHASILTSRYVRSHGAINNAVPIHESVPLLPEILAKHGYETAAFVTSPLVGAGFGFDRGFNRFVERNRGDFTRTSFADRAGQLRLVRLWWRLRGLDRVTAQVDRWLARERSGPFFLWVHQYKPHSPYAPTFSFERRWDTYPSRVVPTAKILDGINLGKTPMIGADLDHIVALYDAEIAFTDRLLERLFDRLAREPAREHAHRVHRRPRGEPLRPLGLLRPRGQAVRRGDYRPSLLPRAVAPQEAVARGDARAVDRHRAHNPALPRPASGAVVPGRESAALHRGAG